MNSFFLLFTVITFNSFFSYKQVPIDSLMIKLNEVTGKDQVDLFNQYSEAYLFESIDLSLKFSYEAYRLSNQLGYLPGTGKAMLIRGKVAFLTGNPIQSIHLLDSALLVARILGDAEWEGDIYRWLARSNEELNELDKSIFNYQSYFDFYEKKNDRANMALALNWQGDLLYRLDRSIEAREHYHQALQSFTALRNQRGKFVTLIKLGQLELNTGFPDRAEGYIHRADQLVQGINEQDLMISYFRAKASYFEQIKPDSALYFLQQALTTAQNSKKYFVKLSILKELSALYGSLERYELAGHFIQEYSRLYDSLYQGSEVSLSDPGRNEVTDSLRHGTYMNEQALMADGNKETFLILLIAGSFFLVFSIVFFAVNLHRFRKGKIRPQQKHTDKKKTEGQLKNKEVIASEVVSDIKVQDIPPDTVSTGSSFIVKKDFAKRKSKPSVQSGPVPKKSPDKESEKKSVEESPHRSLLTLDENLNVKFASKPFCELLQYGQGELIGISIDHLIKGDDRKNEMIFKKITELLEGGEKYTDATPFPISLKNKSGEPFDLDTFLTLYQKGSELLIFFQLFVATPVQKKESEKQMNAIFAPEDLKDFYQSLGLKKKEYLNFVFNQYLLAVHESLIEFHRRINLERSGFYLPDISLDTEDEEVRIFNIYEPIKDLFIKKTNGRIRFHEEIKNDKINVRKKEWIFVITYILLKNAIESIRESGDIYFVSMTRMNQYVLKFADTGEGMPPDFREKAFKPFFTTKGGTENHGLGLSVAREIMERHHGRIKIRSNYGKGTEVVLEFPMKN